MQCTNCNSKDYVKNGFKTTKKSGKIQKYKCKSCNREFTGVEKFHHLDEDAINKMIQINKLGISQRKCSKVLGVYLRSVQYHLKKKKNFTF